MIEEHTCIGSLWGIWGAVGREWRKCKQSMVGGIFWEIEEKESCDCIPSIVGGIFGEIEEKESCDCIPSIVEEMVGEIGEQWLRFGGRGLLALHTVSTPRKSGGFDIVCHL